MNKSVAIYARYSSDLQSEASIEDQVRLAKEYADLNDLELVATYKDQAFSGASRLRPGIQKLLEDARAGKFDVVIAEPSTVCHATKPILPPSINTRASEMFRSSPCLKD